jgi:superfamily II DNA or RNA helicase
MFRPGDWTYSPRHHQLCRVVDSQTVWGETVYRVWFAGVDAVVRLAETELQPASDAAAAGPEYLTYVAAAARVADAMTHDALLAPIGSAVTPLPHQLQALARAVSSRRVRYLLADEVGLGKTIEAGLILRELKLRGLVERALVIAPRGLVTQWVAEMHNHFGEEFRLIEPSTFGTLRQITKEDNLWRLYPLVVCPMDSIKPVEKRRGWSQDQVTEYNRDRFDNLIAAGWDLIVVDEAHRLGGSTDQVARVKLGRALSEAAPYFLLLSATPHQGKTDAFQRILSLLDADAFPDSASVTRERVSEYVIRTEKRRAIDADGAPLFKPRHTRLIPVKWEERHRQQQLLYDAVTEYVRMGYNRAMREKRNYVGFLLLLLQRLVTSSTRAIRSTLERRLEALQQPDEQLSLFPQVLEEEWAELDGQEQIEALLKTRLKAMKNERAEVELLLETARRSENAGPDAKAEALIDWIYQLRQQEGDPDLKVLIFTEFVPTQLMLSEFLTERGFSVACLNGSLDLDGRQQVQRQFAGETEVLVSTEAGGEGLNLQFCHAVVNYDMPWNPMRLEQRIGRVDRIGQKHIVRALNLVLEGTVEYRVREVLEQKLAIILEEFGADKTSDVLDSPEIFDELYVEAMLHPEQVPARVEQTLELVRQQAAAARSSAALLGAARTLDPNLAQQMLEHPLPHWVERMTVSYLLSHGGGAERRGRVWDLTWPAAANTGTMRSVAFHSRDANDVPGAAYIGLEDPRVRGLAERLPLFVPGQAVAGVRLADISGEIRGYWSLWGVRVRSRWGNAEDGGERIMPFFLHEDGRVLPPTARHIWDRLVAGDTILECRQASAPGNILEQMTRTAEEYARPLYQELLQRHRERLARVREKGEYAFTVRRQTINRIGLAAVRSRRLGILEEEIRHWHEEIARREEICPEFTPLVVIHVA